MLIDFHTHAFPDAVAEKAIPTLSRCSGGVVPAYDGKIKSLKAHMLAHDVDYAVVLNIATNPHQEKKVNDFAISSLWMKNAYFRFIKRLRIWDSLPFFMQVRISVIQSRYIARRNGF